MKMRCVDVRETLIRGKLVRHYSFAPLWPDQTTAEPLDATHGEIRITDATERGISAGWRVGSEIEVT